MLILKEWQFLLVSPTFLQVVYLSYVSMELLNMLSENIIA